MVGSNIFNILGVLGSVGAGGAGRSTVPPAALGFDMPVMIAVALACLPIFFTGRVIARWEGAVFLAYYVAYTAYLIMALAQHDALPLFSGRWWPSSCRSRRSRWWCSPSGRSADADHPVNRGRRFLEGARLAASSTA